MRPGPEVLSQTIGAVLSILLAQISEMDLPGANGPHTAQSKSPLAVLPKFILMTPVLVTTQYTHLAICLFGKLEYGDRHPIW